MCRHGSHVQLSQEEQNAAEESLSVYCKPVEFYNILQRRAVKNVTHSIWLNFLHCYLFTIFLGMIEDCLTGLSPHFLRVIDHRYEASICTFW